MKDQGCGSGEYDTPDKVGGWKPKPRPKGK